MKPVPMYQERELVKKHFYHWEIKRCCHQWERWVANITNVPRTSPINHFTLIQGF